jgi:hypothetical protein
MAATEARRGSAPTEVDLENAGAGTIEKVETEDEFPSFKRILLIMPALYFSMFLVALVRFLQHFSEVHSKHVTN